MCKLGVTKILGVPKIPEFKYQIPSTKYNDGDSDDDNDDGDHDYDYDDDDDGACTVWEEGGWRLGSCSRRLALLGRPRRQFQVIIILHFNYK